VNIFFLDRDPVQAAKWLHDVHCRSQINESTQLLSGWAMQYHGPLSSEELVSGFELNQLDPEDDALHAPDPWVGVQNPKHPCGIWLTEGLGNVEWLVLHLEEIIRQYDFRHRNKDVLKFRNGRRAVAQMKPWLELFAWRNWTAPAQAYGPNRDAYYVGPSTEDAVVGYRRYYAAEKLPGATYTEPGRKPNWTPYEPPKKLSTKGLIIGKPKETSGSEDKPLQIRKSPQLKSPTAPTMPVSTASGDSPKISSIATLKIKRK
jgi:hypothetical protein